MGRGNGVVSAMGFCFSARQKAQMAIFESLANPLAGRSVGPAGSAGPVGSVGPAGSAGSVGAADAAADAAAAPDPDNAVLLAGMASEGWPVYYDTKLERWQARDARRQISAPEISTQLSTKWLGHNLLCFEKIDSTNMMAKLCVARQEPRGTVIIAEKQTIGRGRLLRQWVSDPGVGLWFSLILSPFSPAGAAPLPFLIAVSVCRVIREVAGLPAVLKWPNDIMIGDRKVCGILLEVGSDGKSVIAGVGLNVNQRLDEFPAALQETATSLALEAGHPFERPFLLAAILGCIEEKVERLIDEGGGSLMGEYRVLCATIGKRVRIDFPNRMAEYGVVSGIADNGAVIFIPDAAGAGANKAAAAHSAGDDGAGADRDGVGHAREVMAGDITHLRMQN